MNNESSKKIKKNNKQAFLKTFMNGKPENEVKNVNGFILFKHYNSDNKNWQVDIFTLESWDKMNSKSFENRTLFEN